MNRQGRGRFEQDLTKARDALGRKGGKKAYEKVIECVGRAIQKYTSIAKYYVIDYCRDEANPKNMTGIKWSIAVPENIDRQSGIYFLRTNVERLDEKKPHGTITIYQRLKYKRMPFRKIKIPQSL